MGEAMDRTPDVNYTFFSSGNQRFGIKHADTRRMQRFVRTPLRCLSSLLWQTRGVTLAFSRRFDAIVYLGDPHYISTWIGAAIARLRGIRVLFWTHGWRRPDLPWAGIVRRLFYRLANELLIYAERGRRLGVAFGYPAERMRVIYNSLDLAATDAVLAEIEAGTLGTKPLPQDLFSVSSRPVIVCSSRLTPVCRFDLLIQAAARLATRGQPINVLLIGEGPERSRLEEMAREVGVDVIFFGACYEERVLGPLLYHSDITVSPGKVGLTALHSLMYGTPVITHGNLDAQMPEVEVVQPGLTGALFAHEDIDSLVETVAGWLLTKWDRRLVRADCRRMILDKWNPDTQARILAEAIRG